MDTLKIVAGGLCLVLGGCITAPDSNRTDDEGGADGGSDGGDGGGDGGDGADSAPTATASGTGGDSATDDGGGPGDGSGSDDGGSESTGAVPEGPIVWSNNFDDEPVGLYSQATFAAGWNNPSWNSGVTQGRVEVIDGPDAYDGNSLRVHYPAGAFGSANSGGQWWLQLPLRYDELWLSYRIRLDPDFQYVLGGKLPGLIGGTLMEGNIPDGEDGWSARGAWLQDGLATQHLHHMDQSQVWGDFPPWDIPSQHVFPRGQWVRIDHHIQMNTPDAADGVAEAWLDGVLAMRLEGLRFRTTDALGIDRLFFSTFFGGDAPQYAPGSDRTIDFDDFVISEEPID